MKSNIVEYDIKIKKDKDGYLAYIPELDCYGDGETELEAIDTVRNVGNEILILAKQDNILK